MLTLRPSHERGTSTLEWLDARFTFSFGPYKDSRHDNYSTLLLLNDDTVKPGGGFATHEHKGTEVLSYVLDGALAHVDSTGEGSTVPAGDVLVMSAGDGITHSEFNASDREIVRFIQVWVQARSAGGEPRYSQRAFPDSAKRGQLCPIVSPDGRGASLIWNADSTLYASLLDGDDQVSLALADERCAYVHVVRGGIEANGMLLSEGDGLRVYGESLLVISGGEWSEVLVFDLPALRPD